MKIFKFFLLVALCFAGAMIWFQNNKQSSGTLWYQNLGGSRTRQIELDSPFNDANPHLVNIGRMIEYMEYKIRNTLIEIYCSKTKNMVKSLRSVQPLCETKQQQVLKSDLAAALQRRHTKVEN
ncbi:hypothetical protein WA026_020295 [Henosepilachna vigintioctopunctata]|uniref:F-actin-capping protein subunit beta n=1 Tax=Henosepilachna vigintioctopunctata TaxID=420089 RepID=A0AAW1TWF4_9CUCU